jgi:hypothetical protein
VEDIATTVDPRRRLIYDESVRQLEQQERVLESIRTRTGLVIAAIAVASSFLGGQTLDNDAPLTAWSWAAIASLAVAAGCALFVLLPWRGWKFGRAAPKAIQGYLNSDPEWTADEMLIGLASENHVWKTSNAKKLNVRFVAFAIACAALLAEIGFWLVDLGTR